MSGLIFNGNGDVIKAVDGSLTIEGLDLGGGTNVNAGIGTFSDLNVTGTLTYEDVKNVDSVGIISARQSIHVGYGVSAAGIITATSFRGDGSQLTSLPAQATIANNADNRVITGGSGVNLNGEATLTYDGTNLDLGDGKYVRLGASNDFQMWHNGGTGNTNIKQVTGNLYFYTGSDLNMLMKDGTSVDLYYANSKKFETTNTGVKIDNSSTTDMLLLDVGGTNFARIGHNTASGTAILDVRSEGHTRFLTGGNNERLRIASSGNMGLGDLSNVSNVPQVLLHIASTNPIFRLHDTTNDFYAHISADDGGNLTLDSDAGNGAGSSKIIFKTDGSEKLRITNDGTVGIGEDDPDGNSLLIRAASTVQTNKGHIMLTGDSATNGQGPQIVFSESGSGSSFAGAYIGHMREGSNSTGNLVFGTRATGGDANTIPTERLRITSTGKFGINNGTPLYTMHFKNAMDSSPSWIHMEVTGSNAVGGGGGIAFDTSASNAASNNSYFLATIKGIRNSADDGSNDLVFSTSTNGVNSSAPVEKVRITSSGDISIGSGGTVYGISTLSIKPANRTTAFSASDGDTWHDVVLMQGGDAQTNAVGIAFEINESSSYHKNAGTGIAAVKNGTASDYGSDLVFITRGQSTAATEKFRITSGGLMGINTAVPTERLHVSGNAIVTGMILVGDGTTSNCAYANNGDNNTGFYFPAGDHLGLVTGGTERIRFSGGKTTITADGQVTAGHPNMILSVVNAGNASGGSYPGISLRSTHNGAGDGSYIWPTDDNWGLKTDANQAGLAFAPNGHSASSAHARLYIGTDGIITCGPETYNKISYRKSSMTAFGVAGGAVSIGPAGNATACNEPGRYVLGWYMVNHTSSAYHHLKTDMWAGGSPHGNNEWIMGGFKIHGYRYNNAGVSEEIHYFHNWSGNYANYDIEHWGSWNANSLVYTSSDGYVTLRLAGGTYCGYVIDYIQHAWYTNRTTMVTSYTATNNSTI